MRIVIILVITLSLISILSGYSLYENYELGLGRRIEVLDARSTAMGGAGTASGVNVLDSVTNPANIGFMKSGFNFQLISNLVHLEENRSLPMFNFFDSYVDDATYASNTNIWHDLALGVSYLHDFGRFPLAVSVNYRPFISFMGYYEEQVRNNEGSDNDNFPKIIARNFVESEGIVSAIGFTASIGYNREHTYFKKSALALGVNLYRGKSELEKRLLWSEYAHQQAVLDDMFYSNEYEYDGLGLELGVKTDVTSRITVGFKFSPSFKMNVEDRILNIDSHYDYPSQLRAGVKYSPRNIVRTTFTLDLSYQNWSDVSSFYDDTISYYVGVEHLFPHSVPLRLGFSYVTTPTLSYREGFTIPGPIVSPAITAGTGFKVLDNLTLDIGCEFNNRKYEAMDLFPDGLYDKQGLWTGNYRPQNRTEPDTVREYIINVKTSLTYLW